MILAKYLILFWISCSFLAILAKAVFHILRIQIVPRFSRLFFEVFVGVLVVVFFYSIAITKFQTLYLGLIIPLVFGLSIWLKNRREAFGTYVSPDLKVIGKD